MTTLKLFDLQPAAVNTYVGDASDLAEDAASKDLNSLFNALNTAAKGANPESEKPYDAARNCFASIFAVTKDGQTADVAFGESPAEAHTPSAPTNTAPTTTPGLAAKAA